MNPNYYDSVSKLRTQSGITVICESLVFVRGRWLSCVNSAAEKVFISFLVKANSFCAIRLFWVGFAVEAQSEVTQGHLSLEKDGL